MVRWIVHEQGATHISASDRELLVVAVDLDLILTAGTQ